MPEKKECKSACVKEVLSPLQNTMLKQKRSLIIQKKNSGSLPAASECKGLIVVK